LHMEREEIQETNQNTLYVGPLQSTINRTRADIYQIYKIIK
jgi:hypothetical protein